MRKLLGRLLRTRLWRSLLRWPPRGTVRLGSLGRVTPVSRVFGLDRGLPIDRAYIEQFLEATRDDIRGVVLEVGDNAYTTRFGGVRVVRSDVLHLEPGAAGATWTADLVSAGHLPAGAFDCIILTQTLQFIYDTRAAVRTLHRLLKPGGVLLVTVPGISQISRFDMDRWGEHWRFTTLSLRRLLEEAFEAPQVSVGAQGNVLAAVAFLHGLAVEDLEPGVLGHSDPDYEVLITGRAVR